MLNINLLSFVFRSQLVSINIQPWSLVWKLHRSSCSCYQQPSLWEVSKKVERRSLVVSGLIAWKRGARSMHLVTIMNVERAGSDLQECSASWQYPHVYVSFSLTSLSLSCLFSPPPLFHAWLNSKIACRATFNMEESFSRNLLVCIHVYAHTLTHTQVWSTAATAFIAVTLSSLNSSFHMSTTYTEDKLLWVNTKFYVCMCMCISSVV